MKTFRLILALAVLAAFTCMAEFAQAQEGVANCTPNQQAWHGNYYYPAWGQPIALVVPPTAQLQTNYGWGVTNTRVAPLNYQFGRNYPGPMMAPGGGFMHPPRWPSDTTQLGVYYVRGPW